MYTARLRADKMAALKEKDTDKKQSNYLIAFRFNL